MIILNRNLKIKTDSGELVVPISIHQPIEEKVDWKCEYEIGWPTGSRKSYAVGIDSIQSVLLAIQKIGIELYTSDAHKAGKLAWLEEGAGYGFPLPSNVRDLYDGDDKSL